MAVYSPEDVLQVARTKLCKEFPDKGLHPVGSGGGKIWINLPGNARLNLYYSEKCAHYVLSCPSDMYSLVKKIGETLLPGKSPTPPISHSLELIVKPDFERTSSEKHFEASVTNIVNHGKQILELYFENYKGADLKPQSK